MKSHSPIARLQMMTVEELVSNGFTIDRHTYPWTAYIGSRFDPAICFSCRTPAWNPDPTTEYQQRRKAAAS